MSILADMAYEMSLNDREDTLLEPTASLTSNEGITVTHAPVSRKKCLEDSKRAVKHNNEDIIAFVESIMPSENFNAYHHIYTLIKYTDSNGAELTAMKQVCFFNRGNFKEVIGKIRFKKSGNYYITKNGFFADKITKDNGDSCLFTLDNIVIDIDNHENKDLKAVSYAVDKLIFLIQNDYADKMPNFDIVRSGRGCQLWFRLETMHKAMSWLYQSFTRHLIDVLRHIIKDNDIDLEIDLGASTDLARRVRLPFTYNQSTGTQATLERGSNYKYDREDIDEWLSDNPIEKIKEERTTKSRKSEKNYGYNEVDHTYDRLNSKRMLFIERLVQGCNGAVTGRRDMITWLYYNYCCAVLGNREQALERTIQLNQTFTEPQTTAEIVSEIQSVDKVGYYKKITAKTFLEKLNATLEERILYTSMSERTLSRDKARAEKTERDLKILELYRNGLTYQQIADEIDISLATVKRKLKDSSESEKERRDNIVISKHNQGISISDIARDTGLSYNTVKGIINKHYSSSENTENVITEKQSSKASPVLSDTTSPNNTDSVIIFPDTLTGTATPLRETKAYRKNKPLDERLII